MNKSNPNLSDKFDNKFSNDESRNINPFRTDDDQDHTQSQSAKFVDDIISLIDTKSISNTEVDSLYVNRFQKFTDDDSKPFFNFKLFNIRKNFKNNLKANLNSDDDFKINKNSKYEKKISNKNIRQDDFHNNIKNYQKKSIDNDSKNDNHKSLCHSKNIKAIDISNSINQNVFSKYNTVKKELIIVSDGKSQNFQKSDNDIICLNKQQTTKSSIKSHASKFKPNRNYLKFFYKISTSDVFSNHDFLSESNYSIDNYSKTKENEEKIKLDNKTSFIMKRTSFSQDNYNMKNSDILSDYKYFHLNTKIPIKHDSNLRSKDNVLFNNNRKIDKTTKINETPFKFKLFLSKILIEIFKIYLNNIKMEKKTTLGEKVIGKDYDIEFEFMKKTDINNRIFIKKSKYSNKFKDHLKFFNEDVSSNNTMVILFL